MMYENVREEAMIHRAKRSLYGPQNGPLVLSIAGEQNPDPDCYQATNFQAQITADGNGVWILYWTDQVVNEWQENFTELSTAMARLAVLIACYEKDFEVGFAKADFGAAAQKFFAETIH